MRKVFDHPVQGNRDTSNRLLSIRQGSHNVAEFSIEFQTLVANSEWNDEALQGVFMVKDDIALKD